MRTTMLTVLVVAGLAPTLLAGPVLAAAMNGINLYNGLYVNGAAATGEADAVGLNLSGVILPE